MYGAFACKLYAAAGAVFGTTSLLVIAMIGYERYKIVTRGCTSSSLTFKSAIKKNLLCWAYAIFVSIPPFFGWGNYAAEGLLLTCSYDYIKNDMNSRSFVVYGFCTSYFAPLCFVFYFYSQILTSAHHQKKDVEDMETRIQCPASQTDPKSWNQHIDETRVAMVSMTSAGLWFMSWTPYALVVLLSSAGQFTLVTPIMVQLPSFFAKLASVLNPLIYAFGHEAFREGISQELPYLCLKRKGGDDEDEKDNNTCADGLSLGHL
ncbi:compound eye opsin BCRH2 [Eurytemora carolleeae]|uniref:compound eye opsin BCRH2 n=1 Tax=Eurytemora carolleeae TaxID=1294199 RepID=UPI000C78660E|nr:compound eye opsin BCRH2 [Eurytemora carolleeae]|eukprot:XP_023347456.1 compound eye opsin BCRH2-like [Eurytemora affinis]